MARGSKSKEFVTNKILETFEGSFQYEKEIRIPLMEDGELLQIKCTLTCAKENVGQNDDIAIPGEVPAVAAQTEEIVTPERIEPTQEEKENVANLMKSLGF